jgi:hypothetical protein
LNRRQAARELDSGRPGVGSREQLVVRLRELQRAKQIKQGMAAAANGSDSPLGGAAADPTHRRPMSAGSVPMPHVSSTATSGASLEWSERLRQAKAKYWSNLDQLAPEWKSNAQQRRMEQLAKYEQAIGPQTKQQV